MHYLFVLTAREWSGTTRAFTAAARGLAARGHTVTVAVEPESTVEQAVSQESVVTGLAPRFAVEPLSLGRGWLRGVRRLRTLARRRSADVVYVHTDREHLAAAIAFRTGSQARVVRRVPVGETAGVRWRGRLAAWLVPTCFMFASERDLRATALPRRAVAGVVASLGVDPPERLLPFTEQGEEGAGTYIICVHDASSRSRAATAIRTVAMLAPWHPDLQLVVTGEGQYDEDLRMQAAALGVLHLVNFLGERGDELHVMRGARLGWVVADTDTAAYAILDLMALGVPVLAGEGTVAERYLLPQITGVLLPPADAYLTASAVAGLLSGDDRRNMMGDAARLRVAREFPEREMIDGFERAAASVRVTPRRGGRPRGGAPAR